MLFSVRWVLYRIKKWHYYLLDFCYLANLLLLAHLWIWPHSAMLHKVHSQQSHANKTPYIPASLREVLAAMFTIGPWASSKSSMMCDVQVTYAFGSGPLAWSIIAFRNSLVFHSLDKVHPLSLGVAGLCHEAAPFGCSATTRVSALGS